MKQFARKFYNSSAWKQCRAAYIKKVFGLCEKCSGPGHILHHKILLTPSNINDVNVTLNHDCLEYLCLECHNREHGNEHEVVRNGLRFNEFGELEIITPPIKNYVN